MSAPIIKQGAQGEYYEVGGYKYAGTFPYEWAIDHKWHTEIEDCGSGPEWCGNCHADGFINGVFVFYCVNCVSYIYDDESYPKRNGELFLEDIETDEDLWEACPYMRGISLSQIGDKVENQGFTERQLERARYWARRKRYWDAYYDENGRSIFDEGFREPETKGEPQEPEPQEPEPQEPEPQEPEEEEEEEEEDAGYQSQSYVDYYDEGGYYNPYDDWENDPYDDENSITPYELIRLPLDMRAAFDPEYQAGLANFRAAAREM
jgi:hypothetical protein